MRWTIIALVVCLVLLSVPFVLHLNKGLVISTYNKYRIVFLDGGGENCLDALEQTEAVFKSLGNQGTDSCPVKNAVRISKFKDTTLSSSVILSCPTALDTANWLEDISAKHITHMGTLNCRERRGSGLMSEHSFGVAIDISAIDGAIVSEHWKDKGSKGETLREAASAACKYFSNVLTPETNKLHHNHFHLDSGIGFQCDANLKLKLR
jgi:hypothetical protein